MARYPASRELILRTPGTTCQFRGPAAEITATILAVAVYPGPRVQYQVSWWNGRSRLTEWVESAELSDQPLPATTRIGFR